MFNNGLRNKRSNDNQGIINPQSGYLQSTFPQPTITGYSISGYDDTAIDPAGGQTIIVTGTGFSAGTSATLGGTIIGAVTYVSQTQITFTAPAKSAGTYSLVVYSASGAAAILVPGLTYSSVPSFTTPAGSIGSAVETTSLNTSVVATSDSSITYSLVSGSLPSGATLASNGTITGTMPVTSNSTTYTFAIKATDAELQDVTRTFTLTVNPDTLTWVIPSDGASLSPGSPYSLALSATDAAGYLVSYSADTLPAGLTLSAGTISGIPTADGTTNTVLTATAATTGRTKTNTITWVVSLSDAFWKFNTTLLTASTLYQSSSSVNDNSTYNQQLTVAGDTRPQAFHPYQHGYYSYYFSSSTPNIGLSQPALGTQFTIEFWVYPSAAGSTQNYYVGGSTTGPLIGFNGTTFSVAHQGTWVIAGSTNPTLNAWNHIAVVREGTGANQYKLYLNGTLIGTGTEATTFASQTGGQIGGGVPGYISNLRITNNQALYTGAFTPPTSPLLNSNNTILLTANNNKFVDTSPAQLTLTPANSPVVSMAHPFTTVYQAGTQYYSTSFNGSTDYLLVPSTTSLGLGTGDFTIEYWCYPNSISGTPTLIDFRGSPSDTVFSDFLSTGAPTIYINSANLVTSTVALVVGQWAHVAYTRSGTTVRIFINGVMTGNATSSYNMGSNQPMRIGINTAGAGAFNGIISNVRIIKGSIPAGYQTSSTTNGTTIFTPSTTPLTAIANTSLLTCQDSTIKDNSANSFAITVGTSTVKPIAVSPFTPTSYTSTQITTYGGTYFANTGTSNTSWILGPTLPTFGTLDHTVEFWLWQTSSPQTYATPWRYAGGATQQATNDYYISTGAGGGSVLIGGGGVWTVSMSFTVPSNQAWHHYAITRSGTTWKVFIDGVQAATATANPTLAAPASAMVIGSSAANAANGVYVQGYMADFRIVLGTALYTSNFVPQFTSTLTAVTNTRLLTLQTNGNYNNNTFQDTSRFTNLVARNGNVTNGAYSPFGDSFSAYFTSGTDYPGFAVSNTSTGLNFAAGQDFTLECWVYSVNTAASYYLINYGTYKEAYNTERVLLLSNKDAQVWINGTQYTANYPASASLPLYTWNHVAMVRRNNNLTVYLNGTGGAAVSAPGAAVPSSTRYDLAGPHGFWLSVNTTNWTGFTPAGLTGYMSNVRYVVGTAVYTADFTPPTAPLTAISGTQVLTLQSNRFIDNSPNALTYSMNGAPSIQKYSPFGNYTYIKRYSLNFPANGSYVTGTNANFNISATNVAWTFECWVLAKQSTLFFFGIGSGGAYGNSFYASYGNTTAGKFTFYQGNGSATVVTVTSTNTYNPGTWYHYAVCRTTAGVMTQYINGVADGTVTYNAGAVANGTTFVINGVYDNNGLGNNGGLYTISNLRFIINQALYSGTFTPPTADYTTSTVGSTGAGAASSITGSVVLLTGLSTDTVLKDSSANNITITSAGSVSFVPASPLYSNTSNGTSVYTPAVFSGSMYFDGTGDYLTSPYNLGYELTTGDFTIELWVYRAVIGVQHYLIHNRPTSSATGWGTNITASNTINFYFTGGGTLTGTSTVPANTWTHIVFCKSGTTLRIFNNGVFDTSSAIGTGTVSTGTNLFIGCDNGPTFGTFFNGYMSDIRINKVALYTANANFLPPTSPATPSVTVGTASYQSTFLLNGTSGGAYDVTRTVDFETVGDARVVQGVSPYNGSYYSLLLDGSSSYLTATSAVALPIGTESFTVEMWINKSNAWNAANQVLLISGTAGSFQLWVDASVPSIKVSFNGGNTPLNYSTATLSLGTWYHLAVTRSGSNFTMYINGTSVATGTDSGSFATPTSFIIGNFTSGTTNIWNGYISNLRIVRGSANVPVAGGPTSPLTSISGTSLLTCQSNKFVDNSTNTVSFTVTGTPKVQTQNPFQINTNQSYYFDGTGDWLAFPGSSMALTGANFTIEAWVYPSTVDTTYRCVFSIGNPVQIYVRSGTVECYINDSDDTASYIVNGVFGPASSVVANVWTHIALSRNGTSFTVYVNGVAGTPATSSGIIATTASQGQVGAIVSTLPFTGYITDLRVTRGYARYTTAFTPPTGTLNLK